MICEWICHKGFFNAVYIYVYDTNLRNSVTIMSVIYWALTMFRALCWVFKNAKLQSSQFYKVVYKPCWFLKIPPLDEIQTRAQVTFSVEPGCEFSSVWLQSCFQSKRRQWCLQYLWKGWNLLHLHHPSCILARLSLVAESKDGPQKKIQCR